MDKPINEMTGDELVLTKPTIACLIEKLSSFDNKLPVIIEDTDTGWDINIIHIEMRDGKVILGGIYSEMDS